VKRIFLRVRMQSFILACFLVVHFKLVAIVGVRLLDIFQAGRHILAVVVVDLLVFIKITELSFSFDLLPLSLAVVVLYSVETGRKTCFSLQVFPVQAEVLLFL